MKETLKKISCFSQLKTWFVQLSFWKKIIIIFTLNTCLLLILTDSIMLVLFGKISNDIISISNTEKDTFNLVSNTQIAQSTSNMILSRIDLFANILTQLVNTYTFFSANPDIYSSLQTNNSQIPVPTSSFPNVSYDSVGYFNFNDNSTFTDLSFLDQLLVNMISSPYFIQNIKRINLFVQNNNNPLDLTARTYPATSTFTIPNVSQVNDRFLELNDGYFKIFTPYTDTLTTEANKSTLIALRSKITGKNQTLLMQVQINASIFTNLLTRIYYFPSTTVIFAKQNSDSYEYFSNTPPDKLAVNMSSYYPIGSNRVTNNGIDYVSASIGLANTYPLGVISQITNQTSDPLRCIITVQASYIQKPSIEIQNFLNNETNILIGIVLSWSFVILLSTVGLATVVGNYIFFNLKMLSTKMDEYIKDPSKFHLIVIELKQLELKGILKKLSDNLIGIIQKIEVRKRERKDRINQNYHPLSVGQPKFQERQQLNDYEILDQIKEEVRKKVQEMEKEAAQKQRLEKEKAQKQKEAAQKQKKNE